MSSRRSRFKIAANIPVRRKVASNIDLKQENAKGVEFPVKTETDAIGQESVASAPDHTSNNSENITYNPITSSPVKSLNLKSTKSNIQNPAKKLIFESESVKVENSIPDDVSSVLLKSEKVSNTKEPDSIELSYQNDRPKTPPTSLLAASLSGVLKSPLRGRFVRPSLVDAANRRPSFHVSSASESEDESRRLQHVSKTRKISETSSKLENSNSLQAPCEKVIDGIESVECARLALMPKRRRAKVSNFVRKIAEARRDFKKKFAREKPERSKLTMFDLIFYNPGSKSGNDNSETKDVAIKHTIPQEDKLEEEEVDDPLNNDSLVQDEANAPVPQVKIGANGEIILDEKSLVIETTEAKKGREALMNAVPVFEDKNRRVSYFGKRKSSIKEWSPIETKCFYKALNSVGTDFAMMQALFPDRTRAELKNKFKREDRINSQLIDIALLNPAAFNIKLLKEQLDMERTLVERETKRQIEEKAKSEQLRKENLNKKRKLNHDENRCVATLKEFIEVDEILPKKLRSKRGALRRKLCDDFVDPFEVSEDNFTRFKKPSAISIGRKGILNADIKSCSLEPLVLTKVVARPGRPKNSKEVIEKTFVYYPNEEINSDSDSRSSLNYNEKTEEIGNQEFVELINRNLHNLEPTTIRFLAPSPTNPKNSNIRVVVDVPSNEDVKQTKFPLIEEKNDTHPGEDKHSFKKIKDDIQIFSEEPVKNHIRSDKLKIVPNEFEVLVDNLNELHDIDKAKESINSEQILINKSDTLQNSSTSMSTTEDETPGLFEGPITYDDCEPQKSESIPKYSFETTSSEGFVSTEDSVEKRTSGSFQYTVIKSGTSSEQKRTYLAGLTPGSFVFMATDTSAPLQQRCSMYMISEKISPEGQKEFVPLPVFLPPELMELISNEMK